MLCWIDVSRDTTSLRLDGVADALPKVARKRATLGYGYGIPLGFKANLSQRDCVSKPGVGLRHEGLPRVRNRSEYSTPTELCPTRHRVRNLRMGMVPIHFPPGSGFLRLLDPSFPVRVSSHPRLTSLTHPRHVASHGFPDEGRHICFRFGEGRDKPRIRAKQVGDDRDLSVACVIATTDTNGGNGD